MKRQEYFFTAQPVVTDDDGYLGYLWQGIVYTERSFGMSDFDPFLKTDSLFYTPDGAIDEAKRMVVPGPQPIDSSLIDNSKNMDVGDENEFEKWREEMLLGVYDREWREGCELYREEFKCMKKTDVTR